MSIRETSLCPPFPAWPPVRPPDPPMLEETRSTTAGFKAMAAHLIPVPRSGRWRLKSTSTSPRQHHNLTHRWVQCFALERPMVYNVAMSRIHSGSRTGAFQSRAHPREVLDLVSSPHDPFHRPLFRSDSEGKTGKTTKPSRNAFLPRPWRPSLTGRNLRLPPMLRLPPGQWPLRKLVCYPL